MSSPASDGPGRLPGSLSAALPLLAVTGTAALAFLLAAARPVPVNDLAIYVALGRRMMAQGGLADVEAFSFVAPGQPFIHGTWGFSLLAAAVSEAGGYRALGLLNAAAVAVTVPLVAWAARRGGAGPAGAALAALYAWLLLLGNLAPRSQTLAYVLGALLLVLLARPVRWWVGALGGAALGAAWAALHGSFPLGAVLAGLAAGEASVRTRSLRAALPAVAVGAGFLAGTLVGPYGGGSWLFVVQNTLGPRGRGLTEWLPPRLLGFDGLRLGLALLLWAALLVRRQASPAVLPRLLVLGAAALAGTRFISWFGLATAARLAEVLPRRPSAPLPRWAPWAVTALWMPLVLGGVSRAGRLEPETPVDLVAALAAEARQGRVFTPMEWGGYVAERLDDPEAGVLSWPYFLDMRVWAWREEQWSRFLSLADAAPGWEDRLDALGVTHLLLSPTLRGHRLLDAARGSARWAVTREDPSGTLLSRRPAGLVAPGRSW